MTEASCWREAQVMAMLREDYRDATFRPTDAMRSTYDSLKGKGLLSVNERDEWKLTDDGCRGPLED